MKQKGHIKTSIYNRSTELSMLLENSRESLQALRDDNKLLKRSFSDFSFIQQDIKAENFYIIEPKNTYEEYDNQQDLYLAQVLKPFESSPSTKRRFIDYIDRLFHKLHITKDDSFTSLPSLSRQTKSRLTEINEELRNLKIEAKKNPCPKLFLKIRNLINELHLFVIFQYRKQKTFLSNLEKQLSSSSLIDARNHFRNIVTSIYKCFNDFSGSEEEEVSVHNITIANRNNFLSFLIRKTCLINKKSLLHLIHY